MATGTGKGFDDSKAFRFITPDGGGEGLFAHFSTIKPNGVGTLAEGQSAQAAGQPFPPRSPSWPKKNCLKCKASLRM